MVVDLPKYPAHIPSFFELRPAFSAVRILRYGIGHSAMRALLSRFDDLAFVTGEGVGVELAERNVVAVESHCFGSGRCRNRLVAFQGGRERRLLVLRSGRSRRHRDGQLPSRG